jgi:hypothetical protein
MYRKWMAAVCVAVLISLSLGGLAKAQDPLPTWEIVFDPGTVFENPDYFVHSVEEYKGDLYIVAGDPGWFDWETPRINAGQIFRSPDGRNWEPASELGFGLGSTDDACGPNYYDTAWDMAVFQGQIYVMPADACYLRAGLILRSSDGVTWESVIEADAFIPTWSDEFSVYHAQFHKFGVFKGMLYANLDYYNLDTEFTESAILRSPSGAPGSWELVIDFPGWGGPGSFHVFNGALYLASDGIYTPPDWEPAPEQIWRTFDGVKWEMVVSDGFGNAGTDGLGGFADYKGFLYVGVGMYEGSGQIWRSQNGLEWEPVILDGFGNPLDEKIDGLVVHQGELYAYTVNWTEGASVFRTKDAITWERVNTPGWGNPSYGTTHLASGQVTFRDELYLGIIGPQGVLLKLVHP